MTSISAQAGDIWSKPLAYIPGGSDEATWLKANGVTDMELYKEGGKTTFSQEWLDKLSPDQLKETTLGNFDEGARVTTYGDLKVYRDTQNALGDLADTLSESGAKFGLSPLKLSSANKSDLLAAKETTLVGELEDNRPGAVAAAQKFLLSLRTESADTINWQDVSAQFSSENAYRVTHPHGNWSASDGAEVALATLTNLTSAKPSDYLPLKPTNFFA